MLAAVLKIHFGVLCLNLVTNCDGARILAVFPVPSMSHQTPFRTLTQELARRGHKVYVLSPVSPLEIEDAPANHIDIEIKDSTDFFTDASTGRINNVFDYIPKWLQQLTNNMDKFYIPEVNKLIHDEESFDLVLTENNIYAILGLSLLIHTPVIVLSPFGAMGDCMDVLGGSSHPLLHPTINRSKYNNLTFWDKIFGTYEQFALDSMITSHIPANHKMLQKHFGSIFSSVNDMRGNVDMLAMNMHQVFQGNHPVPNNVIFTWGMQNENAKEYMSQDLKTFLDSSDRGVIYMSFGTNMKPSQLAPDLIQNIVNVLCQLPYHVLWKWDEDYLPRKCDNIKISKWFPSQFSILKHPNIKLFITHGGLHSTIESIECGVPLVGIPMMGDQWYNVEKYVHLKIGVKLELETLTEEDFKNAITNVINDESYRRNIRRLAALLRDEPTRPLQRAVWWVEHVLRHGGARHLRAPAANISWAHYFEVQLIIEIVALVTIIVCFCLYLLSYFCRFLRKFLNKSFKIKVK